MVLQTLGSALFQQAYGVYATFWMSEFGWSSTTIALAYSLHRTESALLGPPHGWLLQRFSPRTVVLVGVIMFGTGFMWLAFVPGLAQFIGAFLVMAVGASLAGLLSLTTVLVNWFDRHRAKALSLMATGMSVGGLVIPLVTIAMVQYGWRGVAFASGVLVLLVGVPVSRLMHREPEQFGLLPDGDTVADGEERASSPHVRPSLTTRDALRTKTFWLLSLGHTSGVMIVSAVSVHFVIYAQTRLDMSVTLAASLLTLMTVMVMLGQLVGGFYGDRVQKRLLAGWGMLGHAAAVGILAYADSVTALIIAAVIHGLSWGLRGPLMSAMRADYFGRASFAMIMGASSLIVTLGSVSGPLLAGILVDTTGEYGLAFLILAVAAAACPSIPQPASNRFWTRSP
ncbi:MAG TPA: MFS transporter [Trueperaceae bacterium]|nr:MFS transporter [Trueperaceae bacterium]